jgi:hypothetical protein
MAICTSLYMEKSGVVFCSEDATAEVQEEDKIPNEHLQYSRPLKAVGQ